MSISEQLDGDVDLKNIYVKMVDYLSRNDMSEKRLIKRITLLKLRYPDTKRYEKYTVENCKKVIPLLQEQGFLNEVQYAQNVFNALKDKLDGVRSIRRKMLQRDIDPVIVQDILDTFSEHSTQDLTKIIHKTKQKREQLLRKYTSEPRKEAAIRQKLYSWLSMRGYSGDEIVEIIDKSSD